MNVPSFLVYRKLFILFSKRVFDLKYISHYNYKASSCACLNEIPCSKYTSLHTDTSMLPTAYLSNYLLNSSFPWGSRKKVIFLVTRPQRGKWGEGQATSSRGKALVAIVCKIFLSLSLSLSLSLFLSLSYSPSLSLSLFDLFFLFLCLYVCVDVDLFSLTHFYFKTRSLKNLNQFNFDEARETQRAEQKKMRQLHFLSI